MSATADEVLEAMALAAYAQWVKDETQRGGALPTWEALNDPRWHLGNKRAEQFRAMTRAAIRALPPGWVVAKVPEERFLPDADDEEQAYEDGYNAALAAVRASAVGVE